MRILVCTFTYLPNRDGVAAAADAMARGLRSKGHDVVVATGVTDMGGSRTPGEDQVPVMEFDADNQDPVRRAEERARFQARVADGKFDVVICHCWYTWPADLLNSMSPSLRPPVVMVSHGYSVHQIDWVPRPFWGIGAWLRRIPKVLRLPWHLRDYAWVTFLSAKPDLRRYLDLWVARLTGFRRYSTIPNGTYPERFEVDGGTFRDTYGIHEKLVFLCVANYSRRKNQKLAVRAFRRARLANAVLVLIGSELGEYGREVRLLDEQLAVTQPVGRVVLLEGVRQEMIAAAYVACDVFVLSAREETQPLVLIEAMAATKPWISTDTGGVREMPGGIVVSGEMELAEGLQRLAADDELRSKLGRVGKATSAEKYTWKASVSAYDALVRRLVPEPSELSTSTP